VVTYRTGKPVISKPVSIRVWRWISLLDYDSYYKTGGVADNIYQQFGINGTQYKGWFTFGSYGSWEARYTPGRNCKAFRADLGVNDESADGSSGIIILVTDEGQVIYQSGTLAPGMVETVEVPMALPYRVSVQAANTSADGLLSYPVMGDPAFLCTGV
jgi:hypothetical protein